MCFMKKLTWSQLTIVGVGILATCFVVSFLVNCKFNLETDFLSAAATIFAAVVAISLYSDWREESFFNIAINSTDKINSLFIALQSEHDDLLTCIETECKKSNNDFDSQMFFTYSKRFTTSIELLSIELKKLNSLLKLKEPKSDAINNAIIYLEKADKEVFSIVYDINKISRNLPPFEVCSELLKLLRKNNFGYQTLIGDEKYYFHEYMQKVINEYFK